MLDPFSIVETEVQPSAVIHITIPREKIQEVMHPAMMEVIEAVSAQGIGPAGPVFAYHWDMTPGVFNFKVGVPVSGEVTPVGRVIAFSLPATKVARTVYTGPYEELGDAWEAFMDQIEAAGHKTTTHLWERYVSGPESSPDPSTWRTELNRPIL